MGKLQKEKFDVKHEKIIDYANSKFKNDFLDIYLLGNCEFYFGGDSGPSDIAYTFMKPAYGVNFTSTLLCEGRSHLPYLFIFKRIKNVKTNKLLSLKEILESDFTSTYKMDDYIKNNVIPVENSSKDIKLLAIEVFKDISDENFENEEDIKNQKKFWDIFYKYVSNKDMGNIQPKISPSFLRNNLDLLK